MFQTLSKNHHHDPDNPKSPIYKFLYLAWQTLREGTITESDMVLHEFDYKIGNQT